MLNARLVCPRDIVLTLREMKLCGSYSSLSSHREMAALLTDPIKCRSLSRLSDHAELAAPFTISRSSVTQLDRPVRKQYDGKDQLKRTELVQNDSQLTNKNIALARLHLTLTDDTLRRDLHPDACSSLLLESATSCSAGSWPLLWSCYKMAVSLFGTVSEGASEVLWKTAIRWSYVAHAVEIFKAQVSAYGPIETRSKGVQRQYCGVISQLLKLRGRGLGNKQLAYNLWKEIHESAKASKRYPIDLGGLDVVTCRTGGYGTICHDGNGGR